ncbi:MAG TPA: tryptophan-rich sensory protein [Pyrinomonadaceae bacterium]|nr:tryptophan-rich sensory protein [Pyrinomonadaceae bacterium]
MTERLKQILVVIATLGVIFVNWQATSGKIGNVTTGEISDKYPTFITPSGYAFAIWSLIYFGLILFSIYQVFPAQKENPRFKRIRTAYILSCAANCSWLYAWHYEMMSVSLLLIFVLLGSLAFINVNLQNTESTAEAFLARVPFNLYFGWVTVATIINFTITLLFFGIRTSDSVTTILACLLIVVATVLGGIIRFKLNAAAYALAIAWALTAIAVKQSGKTAIVVVCAFAVIALLIVFLTPFLRLTESR